MKCISNIYRKFVVFFLLCNSVLLNGCSNLVLMNPKGYIGLEERKLILIAFALMLTIVIPVIIMTIVFSIKYRASNIKNTQYDPTWDQSKKIECIIWGIPVLIIVILSILTWKSTHELDPKKIIKSETSDSIIVNVVALDWKWLFIYPNDNIATVNELVFPINVPIQFNITSNAVMNSFFIPQLGSQIYAMAGMQTQLFLIANEPGIYKGISSNFSGQGFSGMKFTVIATKNKEEFNQWIYKVKMSKNCIESMNAYEKLAKPSSFHPITYFATVKSNLFHEVINKFILQNKNCKSHKE